MEGGAHGYYSLTSGNLAREGMQDFQVQMEIH